jgi:hypothetical protein
MDLMTNALTTIQQALDQFVANTSSSTGPFVVLGGPANPDGSANEAARDKIVMMLYSIVKETTTSTHSPAQAGPGGFSNVPPPLYLDLDLAFIANFPPRRYTDGLAALSRVIGFFQQNPILSQTNTPNLDPRLSKLTMDFLNLDVTQVNYVMSMLGVSYMPSVFYRLRMLPFDAGTITSRGYPVLYPLVNNAGTDRGVS